MPPGLILHAGSCAIDDRDSARRRCCGTAALERYHAASSGLTRMPEYQCRGMGRAAVLGSPAPELSRAGGYGSAERLRWAHNV